MDVTGPRSPKNSRATGSVPAVSEGSPTSRAESGKAGPFSPPVLSLPKGGGAIRGIGEKFAANPVTGTGSMTVPIATSPGRSGFEPHLSLSYDSGSGNGPFGFGWSLSLPSIARKTDKGLPKYRDDEESDVFILSGSEDLVPELEQHEEVTTTSGQSYSVRRYRPRIEGLFACIERWVRLDGSGDVHWRSISKENILTLYGCDSHSRISDPDDASHIFSWLICETRDDKGNAVIYRYKEENGTGVDLAHVHERNRGPLNDIRRTANRYVKRIHYGNRIPLLDANARRPPFLDNTAIDAQIADARWMFEVVFDYGEHDLSTPTPNDAGEWAYRSDPFSSYRSGFEVRTTRLCQRVLMFHHFPGEAGVNRDCLVRSTDLTYSGRQDPTRVRNPVYSFLNGVTQTGYRRNNSGYEKRRLPPVEFEYTLPVVQDAVHDVDAVSLANLPIGVDGNAYQWTDLHGEGIPGILTEQAGAWFYKRNLSPISNQPVEFAPLELVARRPNLALTGESAQFMDLAGDGQPDLVVLDSPVPGLYEHDDAESWQPFRPFTSRLNRNMRDPNLKLVDLDGDGHADVLITEDDALVWHASLAEEGFGPGRRVAQALDEEKGPRLVFADGTLSIYLADLSGDGLTDLVRIRRDEICYWPNLGYGRFGAKVTMDHAPIFDDSKDFDHKRIRLADIDGSGTTDIIYLHRDGVRLYFNQSGNGWSAQQTLRVFPDVNNLVSILPADLHGNGTAALVWSSPLPGDAQQRMRYVDLMGAHKPHLLVKTVNNLGAETRVQYAPSTKFYLQDKRDGKPWITRLPFPVHVVERVEVFDHIGRNRFVTRYAYHHGYFDGDEREFRGFGMVEQFDTEQLAALSKSDAFPVGDNVAAESHGPPVHTKTWFHTGATHGSDHVSDCEYFREPGLTESEARALLLPDTVLPPGLTRAEEREASRSLKGAMLRQEVYGLDGSSKEPYPYTVTEQSFTIRRLQPKAGNRHAVFLTHAREAITFHYERNPADPRIQHTLTLEVDAHGNVLKEAAIGYGRRTTIRVVDAQGHVQQIPNPCLYGLTEDDRRKQTTWLATYTENQVTNAIETADSHRTPQPCEARTFELTGYVPTGAAGRFQPSDLVELDPATTGRLRHVFLKEFAYEQKAGGEKRRRPIEWLRTLYRDDDLSRLLPLGQLTSRGLAGESYKLAFTPGLLTQVFRRPHAGRPDEALLPNPSGVLGGQAGDRGGYVQSQALKSDGRFPNSDADDHWWIPSGRSFFSTNPGDSAAAELAVAQRHFFLPRRYRDPFGHSTEVTYDGPADPNEPGYDLLITHIVDAIGNAIIATNDYLQLQPRLVSDPNGNQTAVAFDALGLVAGTAVMGKPLPAPVEGDSLGDFVADLTQGQIDNFHDAADPHTIAPGLLQHATTRLVYDLDSFHRTRRANPQDPTKWLPPYVATIARQTHAHDPLPPQGLKIQISFSYSDGFGREIQKKIQAEPGPLVTGGPVVNPRWVGNGWTIFNNKGKPVRQYEPFFSQRLEKRHQFEFGVRVGVSPVLFYDPVGRAIATLQPNHSYEKTVFDPWQQTTYDVNDTVAPRNTQTGDPRSDPDIRGYVEEYFKALPVDPAHPWQTWHQQRAGGAMGPHERAAAQKSAAHADTPTTTHFDTLGRPFLTLARNRVVCANHPLDGSEETFASRVEMDIEGNQRIVRDAVEQAGDQLGRIVMQFDYDMLGNRVHQASMEAGARWMLNDVTGKPIRAWDSRGHNFTTTYDTLRRPVEQYVRGTIADSDPRTLNRDILVDKIEYGEGQADAERLNLRTRIYRHSDSAGVAINAAVNPNSNQLEAYDFKGNLLRGTRQMVSDYTALANWLLNPTLDGEVFTSGARYDALNRLVQSIAPHSSLARAKRNIIQPVFNEANLLERVDVWLDRASEPAGALDPAVIAPSPVGISNVDYNAKGQRQRIDYKNGASTFYDYDPLTFRLVQVLTTRSAVTFPDDCPPAPPTGWPGCQVQNLHYIYDPAGNVTHIQDNAQQAIYFNNRRVDPSNDYIYDALYRLIEATGREHLGQGGAPIPHSHNDAGRAGVISADAGGRFSPSDGNAMSTYIERYVYDAVGNFLEMPHRGGNPVQDWSRHYTYKETSLIEDGKDGALLKTNNRLTSATLNPNATSPLVERYEHDAHGNMIRMPHLGSGPGGPNMHWDHKDQLRRVDLGGGGTAYYVYDASGQRVRKVWEKTPGLTEERLYLGGFEIFRRHGGGIGVSTPTLERETLHIMDDKQRIAMIETRTLDTSGTDPAPARLIRYQFGNHLGSATLELDHEAQIISYEEYAPYGSTTYQAVRSDREALKRYRYSAKERDEESGLYYYGARYYAAWTGRWTSPDPALLVDGNNPYRYVKGNPIRLTDTTGMWPTVPDISQALQRVNRYGAILMGPGAIAGRSLGKGLQDVVETYTKDKSAGREKAEQLAGDVIASNIPLVGSVQAVRAGVGEVVKSVAKGQEAASAGDHLGAAGHYVDAGLAGLETITLVAGDVIAHAHAPGKIYAKVVEPKVPKVVRLEPTATATLAAPEPATNVSAIDPPTTPKRPPPNPFGALGNEATRELNKQIGDELEALGYDVTGGGGREKETYFPGPEGGNRGSVKVDVTGTRPDDTVHVQTVDTRGKSFIPDKREMRNAGKILKADREAGLFLIPKK